MSGPAPEVPAWDEQEVPRSQRSRRLLRPGNTSVAHGGGGTPVSSIGSTDSDTRAALEFSARVRPQGDASARSSSSKQPCQPSCCASRRSSVEMPLLITTVVDPFDSEKESSITCWFDGLSSKVQVISSR